MCIISFIRDSVHIVGPSWLIQRGWLNVPQVTRGFVQRPGNSILNNGIVTLVQENILQYADMRVIQ